MTENHQINTIAEFNRRMKDKHQRIPCYRCDSAGIWFTDTGELSCSDHLTAEDQTGDQS